MPATKPKKYNLLETDKPTLLEQDSLLPGASTPKPTLVGDTVVSGGQVVDPARGSTGQPYTQKDRIVQGITGHDGSEAQQPRPPRSSPSPVESPEQSRADAAAEAAMERQRQETYRAQGLLTREEQAAQREAQERARRDAQNRDAQARVDERNRLRNEAAAASAPAAVSSGGIDWRDVQRSADIQRDMNSAAGVAASSNPMVAKALQTLYPGAKLSDAVQRLRDEVRILQRQRRMDPKEATVQDLFELLNNRIEY